MNFLNVFCLFFIYFEAVFGSSIPLKEGDSCLTSYGGDGHCKPVATCQWIRDEKIPENDWTNCNKAESLICCKDSPNMTPETTTVVPSSSSTPSPLEMFDYNRVFATAELCEELAQQYDHLNKTEPPAPDEGIANGENALPREFPFAVAILKKEPNEVVETHSCSGSIISSRHILTAAHCIDDLPDLYREKAIIRYGSVRTDENEQRVRLIKTHYPGTYRNSGLGDDIALYLLEDDIQINSYTFPVCLNTNTDLEIESRAHIAGFGELTNRTFPKNLQKAEINIKLPEKCGAKVLKGPFLDSHICAGDSKINSDTCTGDSGGPLTQQYGNLKTLVGITSYGLDFCNTNNQPGVYTRVSSFVPWIKEKVEQDFKDLEEQSILGADQRFGV